MFSLYIALKVLQGNAGQKLLRSARTSLSDMSEIVERGTIPESLVKQYREQEAEYAHHRVSATRHSSHLTLRYSNLKKMFDKQATRKFDVCGNYCLLKRIREFSQEAEWLFWDIRGVDVSGPACGYPFALTGTTSLDGRQVPAHY